MDMLNLQPLRGPQIFPLTLICWQLVHELALITLNELYREMASTPFNSLNDLLFTISPVYSYPLCHLSTCSLINMIIPTQTTANVGIIHHYQCWIRSSNAFASSSTHNLCENGQIWCELAFPCCGCGLIPLPKCSWVAILATSLGLVVMDPNTQEIMVLPCTM